METDLGVTPHAAGKFMRLRQTRRRLGHKFWASRRNIMGPSVQRRADRLVVLPGELCRGRSGVPNRHHHRHGTRRHMALIFASPQAGPDPKTNEHQRRAGRHADGPRQQPAGVCVHPKADCHYRWLCDWQARRRAEWSRKSRESRTQRQYQRRRCRCRWWGSIDPVACPNRVKRWAKVLREKWMWEGTDLLYKGEGFVRRARGGVVGLGGSMQSVTMAGWTPDVTTTSVLRRWMIDLLNHHSETPDAVL